MKPKSFTLDGKRYALPAPIPTGMIEWKVNKFHVGESDETVRAMVRDGAAGKDGWTDRLVTIAGHYAVACHRKNQTLFRSCRF